MNYPTAWVTTNILGLSKFSPIVVGAAMYWRVLAERARAQPDSVGVALIDRKISFAALIEAATARAIDLAEQGLGPGDTVGLSVGDQYRHLVTALALMRLGCPHVVLPTHEPQAFRQALAQRTGTVAVVAEISDHCLEGIPTIFPNGLRQVHGADEAALPPIPPDNAVCLLVASSGTTGHTKVVPLTYSQLYFQSIVFHLASQGEIFYRPTSIEFNNSKRQRLFNLATGGTNVLIDQSKSGVIETCERFGVTLLALSHPQVMALLESSLPRLLPAQTQLRMGGAPVSRELRRTIVGSLTSALFVTYATTESGSIATAGPDHHELDPDIVGIVQAGIEIGIEDDDGRAVEDGATGLLRLRSAAIATGYLGDAEMSARAFRNGWFYPGDRGRLLDGRYLCLEGRAYAMMNLATINIYPSEIERVVRALPGVVDCAAFSVKSADFGDIPLVAVVAREGRTANEILVEARRALGLRSPRKVFLVEALPTTSAGKLVRDKLVELVSSNLH